MLKHRGVRDAAVVLAVAGASGSRELRLRLTNLFVSSATTPTRRCVGAGSSVSAQEWNLPLIALTIARQTGRRIGLDLSTRMAMNAVFAPDREPDERKPRPHWEAAPLDKLERILAEKPQPFRIQFVGAAPSRGLTILREVEIQASGVSAAIVAAAKLAFPAQNGRLAHR